MSKIFILIIEIYQRFLSFDRGFFAFLAPFGSCKFEVSCSEYTKQSIKEQGCPKGLFLGLKRLYKCR